MRDDVRASWQAASPYLDTALDLPPAERAAWLASIRAATPQLADQIAQWLAECDGLDAAFLDEAAALEPTRSALAGHDLGAYRLRRPIGHGGMGSVWLAERADGRFDAQVAVKLLTPALVGRSGEARFAREGRILARLAHPNIARLIDAGVSAIGQPYLVLEYVDGQPIDRFCDDHRLDIDGRLRLFLQVLDALEHAHANLVVHRDLKPSNVLVTTAGLVKVLDFGIARLIDGDGDGAPTLTRAGDAVLTPAYAAPEQIARGDVVAATDVYALGTLLYELLTGRHPAEPALQQPAELMRAIAEVDAPRMSARVLDEDPRLRSNPPALAALRRTTPTRLAATLAGDLEILVATALKKAPVERYATVGALAIDLRRHLEHQPIAARADSTAYRLRKFVRRHRVPVAAAALIVLATAAGLAGTISQARRAGLESLRARQEADAARAERDRARFQARRAQASSEFMRNLVTQIGSTPMSMKEILDRGTAALEQQYGGDQAFVARMLMQLSGPYIELGDNTSSARLMERAMTIARTLDDPELLVAANCGRAYDMVDERKIEAARQHLAEAARHARRLPGSAGGECATAETRLAMLERRFEDAIGHAHRAVTQLENDGETDSTRYTSALNNLATAYMAAERFDEALAAQERVTAESRRIGRGRTVSVVVSLQNSATMLGSLGRWLDSEARYQEAEQLAAGIARDGRVPAYLLVNHGRALIRLAREAEGLERFTRARAQGDLTQGFAAVADLAEAVLLAQRGDAAGAAAIADAGIATGTAALGGASLSGARMLRAWIAHAEGRTAEARRLADELATEQGFPDRATPTIAEILEVSARFSQHLTDHARAVIRADDAIRVATAAIGPAPNAITGRALLTRGLALIGTGDVDAARSALDDAVSHLTAGAGSDHAWTVEAKTIRAQLSR